jgi:hypothetical protein
MKECGIYEYKYEYICMYIYMQYCTCMNIKNTVLLLAVAHQELILSGQLICNMYDLLHVCVYNIIMLII